jgi:hypothetical protein
LDYCPLNVCMYVLCNKSTVVSFCNIVTIPVSLWRVGRTWPAVIVALEQQAQPGYHLTPEFQFPGTVRNKHVQNVSPTIAMIKFLFFVVTTTTITTTEKYWITTMQEINLTHPTREGDTFPDSAFCLATKYVRTLRKQIVYPRDEMPTGITGVAPQPIIIHIICMCIYVL